MSTPLRVTTRNARFQQWHALLTNRTKRQRAGEFIVQGVRPITLAIEYGWPVRALLLPDDRRLSTWARRCLDDTAAPAVSVAPELLLDLGGRADGVPELVAVVGLPEDRLDRIPDRPDMIVVVFDRPTNPGNVGTLVRSADAFGAAGVVITGHAADPYDPQAVRASTGSLFSVPVIRCAAPSDVLAWVAGRRNAGIAMRVIGSDEQGELTADDQDLTGPVLLLVGNETRGLSAGWRESCDTMVRIPMVGAASSLNAAAAGTVLLYESARQRSRRAR